MPRPAHLPVVVEGVDGEGAGEERQQGDGDGGGRGHLGAVLADADVFKGAVDECLSS